MGVNKGDFGWMELDFFDNFGMISGSSLFHCFHSARKEMWLTMGYNISDPTADWLIPDEGNAPQLRSAVEAAQLLRHHLEGKPKIHGFRLNY